MLVRSLFFATVAAFFWAKLEIEIEGKNGWAAELPTWRIDKHPLLDLFYGGRPLTGYHVWAYTFVFFVMHFPFFFSVHWSVAHELHVIGITIFFWVIEDFLWFVLNPHYGLSLFTPAHIWWHKRWFLGIPIDYWMLGATSTALLLYR